MAMLKQAGSENLSIRNLFKTIAYKYKFKRENPDYFDPDGLLCFVGPQGSGKSLSAVNYVYNLIEMYPKAIIVTNLWLTDYPVVTFEEWLKKSISGISNIEEITPNDLIESEGNPLYREYLKENRVFPFNDNDDFIKYNNGKEGVIFLIDEIQLYLNSLESKNINMEVVTQISQQRKQRKHIVCTSQVFGRMAKPLREQFSNVILCKCYAGVLQKNCLIDRDSLESESSGDTQITGKVKKTFLWFHSPMMYKRYDTYYVIKRGKFVSQEKKKGDIYGSDRLSIDS